jgi:hypothetical protein
MATPVVLDCVFCGRDCIQEPSGARFARQPLAPLQAIIARVEFGSTSANPA